MYRERNVDCLEKDISVSIYSLDKGRQHVIESNTERQMRQVSDIWTSAKLVASSDESGEES